MFKNIYYDYKYNEIHLFEQIDGFDTYSKHTFVPYVFVPSKQGNIKTVDEKTVIKKHFNSYDKYREFQEENRECYENKMSPEIQFLVDRYYNVNDEDLPMPKLKVGALDIEVYSDDGFPEPLECRFPIVLLSVFNNITHTAEVFSLKEYTGNGDDIKNFHHCRNESELLELFFEYLHNEKFDIICGWNSDWFDFPYICGRTIKLELKDEFKKVSSINKARFWFDKKNQNYKVTIPGTTILDYLPIYKKYTRNNLPNHKLNTVLIKELGIGKLDYSEYEDLNDVYIKDFNKYVDYNVIDTKRIIELEEKLGYLKLIQSLSILSRTPLNFYNTVTKVIEGIHLVYFRRNNMCAPIFYENKQEHFEAAFVKEPIPNLYKDVIDLDITSSYPSHIITLNMSNETYFGKIIDLSEEKVVEYTRDKEFKPFKLIDRTKKVKDIEGNILNSFNKAINKGMFAIAPCGTIFKTSPVGVMADLERSLFAKRKNIKSRMKKLNSENGDKEKIKQLDAFQNAVKTILNSMFGVTAVPYSRYCNVHISEAITSCGRHTIKSGEKFVNELLNNPNEQLLSILNEIKRN